MLCYSEIKPLRIKTSIRILNIFLWHFRANNSSELNLVVFSYCASCSFKKHLNCKISLAQRNQTHSQIGSKLLYIWPYIRRKPKVLAFCYNFWQPNSNKVLKTGLYHISCNSLPPNFTENQNETKNNKRSLPLSLGAKGNAEFFIEGGQISIRDAYSWCGYAFHLLKKN